MIHLKSNTTFFVEKKITLALNNAELSLFETNCFAENIEFCFNNPMVTMMLSGKKEIVLNKASFSFNPGTVFITPKDELIKVNIPTASISNPTKCLVLNISNSFIENCYAELLEKKEILYDDLKMKPNDCLNHFILNDHNLSTIFTRLFNNRINYQQNKMTYLLELNLKEMCFWLFQSQAQKLLLNNSTKNAAFSDLIFFIKQNLNSNLNIQQLTKVCGMSESQLFKKFKLNFGLTPIDYINLERIEKAKIMLLNSDMLVKEIAYSIGFNTQEHFTRLFTRIVGQPPGSFKKTSTQVKN